MMKKIWNTLMLLAPVVAMAQGNTYALKGKFKSAAAEGKVYLNYYKDGTTKRDSAVVQNGVFELKGPSDGPQQVYLTFVSKSSPADKKSRNRDSRSMYLDKGVILMTVADSIKTATINGSAINTDYKKYTELLKASETAISSLRKEYYGLSAEQKKDSVAVRTIEDKMDKADSDQKAALATYIKQNPDSYFCFEALQKVAGPYFDISKVEPLFNGLSAGQRNAKEGQAFAASIAANKSTAIGKAAPDFTHLDMGDKPVKLSDFKGKYVLLDFWASWCGPCRAENPNVLKAYNAYKDKNFTVLGVSVDQEKDKDKWLKAIKDDGMPWTQLIDSDRINKKRAGDLYAIKSIPSNFLIDPSGKIIAKNLRGEALEKKLAEVIK
jgi:peroxiredoxin